MVKVSEMGRPKLGREPFNLTMPPELAQAAKDQAAKEHRTASALVEELLRAYLAANAPKRKAKT